MIEPGVVHIWRIRLNRGEFPPPTAREMERAERFATPTLKRRYLRAHSALRDILSTVTGVPLEFAAHEHGKPYLPLAPEVRFNLAHSHEQALVAVTQAVEVGVDIESIRSLPEYPAIAQRYFPPEYPAPSSARHFFRLWTRFEACLKAQGSGLYGAGATPAGTWSVAEIDAGPRFIGALAVEGPHPEIQLHDYRRNA